MGYLEFSMANAETKASSKSSKANLATAIVIAEITCPRSRPVTL